MSSVGQYILVTIAYWGFTLTDGALRMLVLLHFHDLGYGAFQIASLFLFYEFFGIVTNLGGSWVASHFGLKSTLVGGLFIQILALVMLAVLSPNWSLALSVGYVMTAQALSGIAKDLTKMSAKSGVKTLVPENAQSELFKWVAILTGSKNALKGAGFFLGGLLLSRLGFANSLYAMAGGLTVIAVATALGLPNGVGRLKSKVKFRHLFSMSSEINYLSGARLFLFGARDVWFVVALPVFLQGNLGWSFTQVGSFLALWVIGYGLVQAMAPILFRKRLLEDGLGGSTLQIWSLILGIVPAAIAYLLDRSTFPVEQVLVIGLLVFGAAFAINSALHSYLILAYAKDDKVALNVGFYYMANAGGRLLGTVLSGLIYQIYGLTGCLWFSAGFVATAGVISHGLRRVRLVASQLASADV